MIKIITKAFTDRKYNYTSFIYVKVSEERTFQFLFNSKEMLEKKVIIAWAEKIAKDNNTTIVNAFEIMEMIISDYLFKLDKNNTHLVINDTSEFIDAMIKHSLKE